MSPLSFISSAILETSSMVLRYLFRVAVDKSLNLCFFFFLFFSLLLLQAYQTFHFDVLCFLLFCSGLHFIFFSFSLTFIINFLQKNLNLFADFNNFMSHWLPLMLNSAVSLKIIQPCLCFQWKHCTISLLPEFLH